MYSESDVSNYTQALHSKRDLERHILRGVLDKSTSFDQYLVLRKCRRLYSVITEAQVSRDCPEETLGCVGNTYVPLAQVAVRTCINAESDNVVYHPILKWIGNSFDLAAILDYLRVQKRPWTFLSHAKYPVHDRVVLGTDRVSGSILSALEQSPITVYTPDAVTELGRSTPDPYYPQAYVAVDSAQINTGLMGTLHMNTLLVMNLGDDARTPDMAKRDFKDEQTGFVCAGYTSHSTDAGTYRRVAHGTTPRLWDNGSWHIFKSALLKASEVREGGNCVIMLEGFLFYTTPKCLSSLVQLYLEGELSLATLHTFEVQLASRKVSVLHISIAPGILMRCLDGTLVDSRCVRFVSGLTGAKLGKGLTVAFSTYFQMVPFITYDRPPRTLISAIQALQAVCHPHLLDSSLLVPSRSSVPLVVSDFMLQNHPDDLALLPGENVTMLLMNLNDNYEDCILVRRSSADAGLLSYTELSTVTLEGNVSVSVGDVISMSTHRWWHLPFDARVVSMTVDPRQRTVLTLHRDSHISDGDKVATAHGQKGVIRIVEDADLPYGVDENGERVDFDVIMSASSVFSRVTVGQIFELEAGKMAARLGRTICPEEYFTILDEAGLDRSHTSPVQVWFEGEMGPVCRRMDGIGPSPIQCDWGVCRLTLLRHLSYGKHHFTRIESRAQTKYTASGRSRGGSVKLGDMEVQAMCSSGLTACLQELIDRRDVSIVSVCATCNRIGTLCDCEVDMGLTRTMAVPYSTLVLDMINAVTIGSSFQYFPKE